MAHLMVAVDKDSDGSDEEGHVYRPKNSRRTNQALGDQFRFNVTFSDTETQPATGRTEEQDKINPSNEHRAEAVNNNDSGPKASP